MTNSLRKLAKDLKAFAKRCKDFKYTEKALFVFLLCGIAGFADVATTTDQAIQNKRQEISTSIGDIRQEFKKVKNSDSVQGKKVQELLNKEKNTLTEDDLRQITAALLSFEKEQNPVNDEEEKKNFKSRMYPALDVLEKAIQSKNVEQMKKEYLKFNGVWTRNESFIRSRSVSYYGKVETAMSFLRSSMEVEPFDYENTMNSFNDLKSSIQDYLDGKKMENNVSGTVTLKEAVDMLKDALEAFKNGDKTKGQSKVKEFIQVWPTVEGDVSTRNSALYTKVETQTPIIMVKGTEKQYQDQLQGLITELSQIDTKAKYTFIDAMFILLREGVEALLIVLALVSSLKAANQKKGLRWVYAGAAAGILASVVIAFILQALFPAVSSGTNREILEGFVGIFAVVMMIGIGFWLHSKSSLKSWKNYIDRKMDIVLSTGSFVSMFVLSFLAVFREGAETILFYVGILPRISTFDFVLGISLFLAVCISLFRNHIENSPR